MSQNYPKNDNKILLCVIFTQLLESLVKNGILSSFVELFGSIFGSPNKS